MFLEGCCSAIQCCLCRGFGRGLVSLGHAPCSIACPNIDLTTSMLAGLACCAYFFHQGVNGTCGCLRRQGLRDLCEHTMPSSGVATSGGHVASGVTGVLRVTACAGRADAGVAFIYSTGGCQYFCNSRGCASVSMQQMSSWSR